VTGSPAGIGKRFHHIAKGESGVPWCGLGLSMESPVNSNSGKSSFLITLSLVLLTAAAFAADRRPTLIQHTGNPDQSGLEMLYASPISGFINTFPAIVIDPNTGGFSSFFDVPNDFACTGGVVTVAAQFLYVSLPPNCVQAGGQLAVYSLDPSSGEATPIAGSPFSFQGVISPQGLAATPNGDFLYLADSGQIDGFAVDGQSGVPTPVKGSPFASGNNTQLTVDPSGKVLYASNDNGSGSILAFAIESTGTLKKIAGSPFAIAAPTAIPTQPTGIVDTGKFVYTALFGSNGIATFSVNSKTGALTSVPGSPFPSGAGPAYLVVAGNFLYVVNEADGNVSGFSINPATGVLTPVPGSPFGSGGSTLVTDVSGQYLYLSRFDGILGYDINPETGALSPGEGSLDNDGALWMTVVQLPPPGDGR
jgi:6-phosphogluconolactonase (cycloisomerase 2 family)